MSNLQQRSKDVSRIMGRARSSKALSLFGDSLHTCLVCGKSAEHSPTWNKLVCIGDEGSPQVLVSGVCRTCPDPAVDGTNWHEDWRETSLILNIDLPVENFKQLAIEFYEACLECVPEGTMLVTEPFSWQANGSKDYEVYFWKHEDKVRSYMLPYIRPQPWNGEVFITKPAMHQDVLRAFDMYGVGEHELDLFMQIGETTLTMLHETN